MWGVGMCVQYSLWGEGVKGETKEREKREGGGGKRRKRGERGSEE